MAQSQVTYTDKVENGGATNEGKCLATDLNELKTVVNANATDTGDRFDNIEGTEIKIGNNAGATSQGANSVSVGNFAGNNTQGSNSTAIGNQAGQTSQGVNTIAVGNGAGNNTQEIGAVAVGFDAGNSLQSSYAVSVGSSAGTTSQGDRSIAIGVQAGNNTQSNDSIAIGREAGKTTQGVTSVAIGQFAGQTSQATNCVAIGNIAGQTNQPANSTCLGNNAQVTATNQVQLGNSSTTTYAYGAVQDRSDERDKADIEGIHLGLDFIDALTPRSYKFDYREDYREHTTEMQEVITQDEGGNNVITHEEVTVPDTRELGEITHDGTHKRSRLHCGLVAQEVKQVMDDLGVDFGGYQDHSINGGQDVLSIGYGELIAPMIKAIQELKAEIDILKGQ